MNNLLFYALLMALLYYFFIYLPSQKKLTQKTPPLFEHKETQTEFEPNSTDNEPGAVHGPGTEDTELEKTVEWLIKDIREFNQKLDA